MTKLKLISVAILLATASVAHAQTAAPLPGDQGITSVNKNLEKNPDNKGLLNADEKLKQNQIKHKAQAEKRLEKKEERSERKAERNETHTEHHEAAGRPARVERPAKVDRPGK